jgi:hypothetical protein
MAVLHGAGVRDSADEKGLAAARERNKSQYTFTYDFRRVSI